MRDPSSDRRQGVGRHIAPALLVVLLLCAVILRFAGINWDQHQQVHPDERFIVWVADTLRWPDDLATALDPERSTINPFRWPPGDGDLAGKPRNYAYGHFPLYLLSLAAHGAQAVASWFGRTTLAFPPAFQPIHTVGRHLAEYRYLPLVGRGLSALADLGTLLLVYALGRKITNHELRITNYKLDITLHASRSTLPVTGLIAAAIYTFAVLPIQLSHFVAVDAILTFCVTASVALAARWARRGGWVTWLLAGVMAGLAVGSKFSAVLLALPLAVAALYRLPTVSLGRKTLVVAGRLAAAGLAALVVFVLTNPFAAIEFPAYVRQIAAQNAMVSGVMDAPYTRQYLGTLPYLYFVQQLSQWGLGWPLGIVAWGGLIWAFVVAVRRKASPTLVVMLAWALPYFAFTGAFHTKFLRYMAPLLPFLAVFAAGAAVAGYRWLAARWGRRGVLAWSVLAAGVAVFTLGWTLAFTGVYRQEHPWIAASRWIYANVPEGKTLLTEHWDDSLPLTLDDLPGKPPTRSYRRTELPLWDADTPEKLDTLVDELSSADYIVLASNRLSAPMARLRDRYPMSSQYYRMLFAGDLGYRPVAEFTAYPRLGNWVIRDDNADESFSVYDHPRVLVFENVGRLKPELLRARLGRYLPTTLTSPPAPSPATRGASLSPFPRRACPELVEGDEGGGGGKVAGLARYLPQTPTPIAPLTLSQPVDTLPVVADFRWNRVASESAPLAVALWWLALSLLGWLAWPLLFPLLSGLRDRGYGLARVAGWLLVGWVHWLGVSLGWWQNRLAPLVAVVGILSAAGLIAGWLQRRSLAAFWAEQRRTLLAEEAIFALAYLAFVGVRLLNPDLWQPWNGGEKFMEFAFLNATLRSPDFPPYDPYFAGGIINYYYYGLYLVGLIIKLTGIAAEVAFNLAVPSLFALTALGLFSAGSSLADARRSGGEEQTSRGAVENGGRPNPRTAGSVAGGLAVLLALLMGNLRGLGWLATVWSSFVTGKTLPEYDYWAVSRVIPNTINEFPLWTFIFADLHPHMIAMPFGLLVVGLALNWVALRGQESGVRGQGSGDKSSRRSGLVFLSTCLLIILALGALGVINTWDLPTYALLVAGAFVVAGWRTRRWLGAAGGALLAALISLLAVAAYWPFYTHYQAQVGQGTGSPVARFLGWVRAGSPLDDWLVIWGFFLLLAICYVVVIWRQGSRGAEDEVVITVPDEYAPGEAALAQDRIVRQAQDAPIFRLAAEEDERDDDLGEVTAPGEQRLTAPTLAEGPSDSPIVSRTPTPRYNRIRLIALLGVLGFVVLLAGAGRPNAAIAALPLCLALPLAFRRKSSAGEAMVALLLALGLSIIAGTELIYLRDFLEGGDWYRMNTLFKFSVPAWLFLALAGGVMLPVVWSAATRASAWIGVPVRAALGIMLVGGLVFLIFGIPARVQDRFPGERPPLGTLDGTAYMTVGHYGWPSGQHPIQLAPEREAIRWLLDNVTGTPVIAEAPAGSYEIDGLPVGYDYYRAGGLRVASLTGFPTFLGQHQYEQRPGDQVGRRFEQGKEFFTTTDLARARELMQELGVGYVYVGQLERLLFSDDALRKFAVMADLGDLEIVYQSPEVTIYRVLS